MSRPTAIERNQTMEDTAATYDPRLHVQISRHVRKKITEGTLTAGDAVSITYTAQEWGASRQTVSKALHTLERDGLLKRYPGVGFYVQPSDGPLRKTRDHR
jgi:DNA-binding GntR family transcriptional regulator